MTRNPSSLGPLGLKPYMLNPSRTQVPFNSAHMVLNSGYLWYLRGKLGVKNPKPYTLTLDPKPSMATEQNKTEQKHKPESKP